MILLFIYNFLPCYAGELCPHQVFELKLGKDLHQTIFVQVLNVHLKFVSEIKKISSISRWLLLLLLLLLVCSQILDLVPHV